VDVDNRGSISSLLPGQDLLASSTGGSVPSVPPAPCLKAISHLHGFLRLNLVYRNIARFLLLIGPILFGQSGASKSVGTGTT
jgi:hypothetical protein